MTAKDERDRFRVTLMLEAVARVKADLGRFKFQDFAESNSDARKILRSDLIDLIEPAENLSRAFVRQNPRLDVDRMIDLRNKQVVHEYPDLNPEDVWAFLTEELDGVERALKSARYPRVSS